MSLNILNSKDFIFFTTRDFAIENQLSISAASKQLHRLYNKDIIQKITRGLWANPKHPYFTPLGAIPYIVGHEQGYASFLTALHRCGMISQIPTRIQIATTGHSRALKSPIGDFELIQMNPRMMQDGILWSETKLKYLVATPEKALLDTLYISTRKGKQFHSLPELDFQESRFNEEVFFELLEKQVPYTRIQNAILEKISLKK